MATVDPVSLAQALIRCPSVTPADAGALDVLGTTLEGLGFATHRLRFEADGTAPVDNLYARLGDGTPNFCFAGHTDVVPEGEADAWRVDPFAGAVVDGELVGRGASDMKGAIACFVAATERFVGENDGVPGSISLLITGDEEGPAVNGTAKVLDWMRESGERIDACLVGEPTNPDRLGQMMKIGRRGSMNVRLTVRGVQGHVAYPHLADNPAHRLTDMLHAITSVPLDDGSETFQPSTLQITTIDVGNTATNVIPATATAAFNIRFNDRHDSTALTAWLRRTLDEVGGDYELQIQVSGESFVTPPGTLSGLVSDAVESVLGDAPELSTTGGTSDARFIKDHCPVVEFGMVGKTMHKVDERVPLADLATLTDIYFAVLQRYFRS